MRVRAEGERGRTGAVDLVHVRLEDEAALDDFGEDVVCLGVRVRSVRGGRGPSGGEGGFPSREAGRTSSKWNTRSSSHTFSNAPSRDSTKTWCDV